MKCKSNKYPDFPVDSPLEKKFVLKGSGDAKCLYQKKKRSIMLLLRLNMTRFTSWMLDEVRESGSKSSLVFS
jgi:hypothetical protein